LTWLDFPLGPADHVGGSTEGLTEGRSALSRPLASITSKHNDKESSEMSKIKALFGLTVMVGLLAAITASSASALFSSTNSKAVGQGKASGMTFIDGSASIECASAALTWKLTKGQGANEVSQLKGAENLDLHVNASNAKPAGWENCKSNSSLGTVNEVSGCELQLKQTAKGQKKQTGSILTTCAVTTKDITGTCIVGFKGSGNGENIDETIAEETKDVLELRKLDVETTEACGLGGLKKGEGELTGETTSAGVVLE
jgi:hypothetical protein